MTKKLKILDQPDLTTCGPTSLHAVYNFWGDDISLSEVISGIRQFEEGGGTLAVILGMHALERGYKVHIYSYNVNIFDPTWFKFSNDDLIEKLNQRIEFKKHDKKDLIALKSYRKFLQLGGKILFEDLNDELIHKYLYQGIPILTGLSSTWLYRTMRENPITMVDTDVEGEPSGHFVVLYGEVKGGIVHVADPYKHNPISKSNYYKVDIDRLMNSILLGISTYDGNLLIIQKRSRS